MFWDKVAFVYDIFVNVINRKVHEKLKEEVFSLIQKEDVVLECACGTGMLSRPIALKCKTLIANDLSQKMTDKARQNCKDIKNIEFETADIMKLRYEDDSFDKVVAANVIHLLDQPQAAVKELMRVCKDGGTLIIPTYMNKEDKKKNSSFIKTIDKAGADFKQGFDVNSYKRFFEGLGFKDGEYSYIEGKIPCCIAILKLQKNDQTNV